MSAIKGLQLCHAKRTCRQNLGIYGNENFKCLKPGSTQLMNIWAFHWNTHRISSWSKMLQRCDQHLYFNPLPQATRTIKQRLRTVRRSHKPIANVTSVIDWTHSFSKNGTMVIVAICRDVNQPTTRLLRSKWGQDWLQRINKSFNGNCFKRNLLEENCTK